jgi:hypothetical protein
VRSSTRTLRYGVNRSPSTTRRWRG